MLLSIFLLIGRYFKGNECQSNTYISYKVLACRYLLMIISMITNDYQMANDFGKFFAQKIADIRSAITNQICLPVTINATSSVTASCFSEFDLLSESEVFDLITASSKKSCPLDPIPTKLLTEYVDVLLPPITKIINLSLDSGHFPRTWKCALVRPLLKKDGLPPVFKNFRPVSNLAFISKLVETVVAKQLRHYLNCNNLFPVSNQPIDRTTAQKLH